MSKKQNILILVPGQAARGGITNYYNSLRPFFPSNIIYLTRGSRNWPNRRNRVIESFRLIFDFLIYILYILFLRIKLVQITTAFSLKSIQRDTIFILIANLLRRKVIVFFRGWDENSFNIFEGKNFYKKTFFSADAIIDLKQSNIDQLIKWGYLYKTYLETTVVDNSLIPYIANLDLEATHNKKLNRPITVLFLARIEKRKGIYEAINTFGLLRVKYPEINFIIAGDGSEESSAKSFCEEKGMGGINFLGFVSGIEKARCFINADIYLFPSYSEGMPSSVLEAMSFGLPVVTTNVGGLSDFFINGRHGFIVERNEPEILCECISKIIDNKDLMYSIAFNNYQISQKLFLPEKVNKRILNIFEETLNSNLSL